ncbi:MAG: hypothetical protein WAS51_06110 [Ilumatobacteraceae bacterium]
MPDETLYENGLTDSYAEEVERAHEAGVGGVLCPSDEFDRLAAEGERLVFVVTVDRMLVVAPQLERGFEIRHPVLAGGEPVLAAGELAVLDAGRVRVVLDLTNQSGHYEPGASCLAIAAEVLIGLGFEVPAEVVRPYPGA